MVHFALENTWDQAASDLARRNSARMEYDDHIARRESAQPSSALEATCSPHRPTLPSG